jgi:hypothetical protein
MGGLDADLSLEEAIPVLLDIISKITIQDSGRYMDRFGKDINFWYQGPKNQPAYS